MDARRVDGSLDGHGLAGELRDVDDDIRSLQNQTVTSLQLIFELFGCKAGGVSPADEWKCDVTVAVNAEDLVCETLLKLVDDERELVVGTEDIARWQVRVDRGIGRSNLRMSQDCKHEYENGTGPLRAHKHYLYRHLILRLTGETIRHGDALFLAEVKPTVICGVVTPGGKSGHTYTFVSSGLPDGMRFVSDVLVRRDVAGVNLNRHGTLENVDGYDQTPLGFFLNENTFNIFQAAPTDSDFLTDSKEWMGFRSETGLQNLFNGLYFDFRNRRWITSATDNRYYANRSHDRQSLLIVEATKDVSRKEGNLRRNHAIRPPAPAAINGEVVFIALAVEDGGNKSFLIGPRSHGVPWELSLQIGHNTRDACGYSW